jgi:hypothetical protein
MIVHQHPVEEPRPALDTAVLWAQIATIQKVLLEFPISTPKEEKVT